MRLDADAIHSAVSWPAVLEQLGIEVEFLRNRHGPCPACGGRDRYRFDDREGRGTWICNQCGAGDGFRLLMLVHGWDFRETRRHVIAAAGLDNGGFEQPSFTKRSRVPEEIARPSGRVERLLRGCASPDSVADVIEYLESRKLWPLPAECSLRAHAAADYWSRSEDGAPVCLGRFPALVAEVRDVDGALVTLHVTYLRDGRKLEDAESRKILSPLRGRRGCAVRLLPLEGNVLGLAEGVETALAAHALHGLPVWAALNTALLAKFEPPPSVHRVVCFADKDVAGLEAALALTEHLDGRASVETRTPPAPAGDWADMLEERAA
jgi:putative DNA primase/helicase